MISDEIHHQIKCLVSYLNAIEKLPQYKSLHLMNRSSRSGKLTAVGWMEGIFLKLIDTKSYNESLTNFKSNFI